MSITKHTTVGTFLLLATASFLPSLVVAHIGQLPLMFGHNSPESPLKGWDWFGGFPRSDYEYGISEDVYYHGNKCLFIRSLDLPVDPTTTTAFPGAPFMPPFPLMATLSQAFNANQYRGKRMKFSAIIKSEAPEGSAALTMTISGKCYEMLAFDRMYGRNITGNTEWNKADVVLDVPVKSTNIQFGITMHGKGQIWVSGLVFEETTDDSTGMKMYEDEPRNLDFSE